ncbi:hypothetical protein DL96DRAFT_260366 [Flagelloscypha sp. PMI_526]|nr:hypothetical protein DL96DRAFT_260366 [Flagelloscypha sp. PMI_526]
MTGAQLLAAQKAYSKLCAEVQPPQVQLPPVLSALPHAPDTSSTTQTRYPGSSPTNFDVSLLDWEEDPPKPSEPNKHSQSTDYERSWSPSDWSFRRPRSTESIQAPVPSISSRPIKAPKDAKPIPIAELHGSLSGLQHPTVIPSPSQPTSSVANTTRRDPSSLVGGSIMQAIEESMEWSTQSTPPASTINANGTTDIGGLEGTPPFPSLSQVSSKTTRMAHKDATKSSSYANTIRPPSLLAAESVIPLHCGSSIDKISKIHLPTKTSGFQDFGQSGNVSSKARPSARQGLRDKEQSATSAFSCPLANALLKYLGDPNLRGGPLLRSLARAPHPRSRYGQSKPPEGDGLTWQSISFLSNNLSCTYPFFVVFNS